MRPRELGACSTARRLVIIVIISLFAGGWGVASEGDMFTIEPSVAATAEPTPSSRGDIAVDRNKAGNETAQSASRVPWESCLGTDGAEAGGGLPTSNANGRFVKSSSVE